MPPEPVRGAGRPGRLVPGEGFRSGVEAAEALRREGRDAA